MRVTILGSGGGLGIPNPFCRCANCQSARADGGKSLRNAPAVLINDDLLIDCGPDVVNCVRQQNLTLGGLRTLVITHRHSDHLEPWFFWGRRGVMDTELPLLTVYAPQDALSHVLDFYRQETGWDRATFEAQTRTVWRPIRAGMMKIVGRYRLHFFPAVHGEAGLEAVLPGVLDAYAGYFHCYDTGPLPEEMWGQLAHHHFDLAAIDACIGLQTGYQNPQHMTANQTVATAERLREMGILKVGGTALATHFVHQDAGKHACTAVHYETRDLVAAYDGLTFTLGEQDQS